MSYTYFITITYLSPEPITSYFLVLLRNEPQLLLSNPYRIRYNILKILLK